MEFPIYLLVEINFWDRDFDLKNESLDFGFHPFLNEICKVTIGLKLRKNKIFRNIIKE
ncbi:hypothetical protein LEP1GSC043_4150 [Leptospira weilii str. Ecochallenge]|uniref:Uncharacterized protein n=1 Tax=Leptospira weilii str. Ecochallenge TaxID=1049986 RepID=N1U733_9LEPT|nr:hypothetical protein LEP1GSC043_4150 [Leptospira weilii str. Ecochallenge]